jgi:hypothetical protein
MRAGNRFGMRIDWLLRVRWLKPAGAKFESEAISFQHGETDYHVPMRRVSPDVNRTPSDA